MDELNPGARAFLEQKLRSASLQQSHRARIWTQLHQRLLAERSHESPTRSREPALLLLALRKSVSWPGSVVVSCAILASAVGIAKSIDRAAERAEEQARQKDCASASGELRAPSMAPSALAEASNAAAPPPAIPVPNEAAGRNPHPKPLRVGRVGRNTTPGTRSRTPLTPYTLVAALPSRQELLATPAPRLGKQLVSSGNGRTKSVPVVAEHDFGQATARHGEPHFGAMPGWLEFTPHVLAGIAPLGEGWFESPTPLRLTQPQLRLQTVSFE
jgi:hypothetical protein